MHRNIRINKNYNKYNHSLTKISLNVNSIDWNIFTEILLYFLRMCVYSKTYLIRFSFVQFLLYVNSPEPIPIYYNVKGEMSKFYFPYLQVYFIDLFQLNVSFYNNYFSDIFLSWKFNLKNKTINKKIESYLFFYIIYETLA